MYNDSLIVSFKVNRRNIKMWNFALSFIIFFSFITTNFTLPSESNTTSFAESKIKVDNKFDITCLLKKLIDSLKLKSDEKLKFIFNPFEAFPTTDDVKEVITTPKYLLANLAVVHIIAKIIGFFVVMTYILYNSQFNSLFK